MKLNKLGMQFDFGGFPFCCCVTHVECCPQPVLLARFKQSYRNTENLGSELWLKWRNLVKKKKGTEQNM